MAFMIKHLLIAQKIENLVAKSIRKNGDSLDIFEKIQKCSHYNTILIVIFLI